jgi:hypothetical protein
MKQDARRELRQSRHEVTKWHGASNRPAGRARASKVAKFAAFAVDINGTALARYDLAATEKESAEQEARQYLEQHPVIEVWSDDHRRVARLVRE